MVETLSADQIAALAQDSQKPVVAVKIDLDTDLLFCSGEDQVTFNFDDEDLLPIIGADDFEDQATGAFPVNWTKLTTTGDFRVRAGKYLEGTTSNDQGVISLDGTSAKNGIVTARLYFEDTDLICGVCARLTGSGAALRGYEMRVTYDDTFVQLRRLIGDGNATALGFADHGITLAVATWYWLKYKIVGSNHYAKFWEDGNSEPGGWISVDNDSTHSGPGDAGFFFDSSGAAETYRFDDFTAGTFFQDYTPRGLKVSAIQITDPRRARATVEIDDLDGTIAAVWYGERFSGQTVTITEAIWYAGDWVVTRTIPWVCETCQRTPDGRFVINLSGAGGMRPRAGLEIGSRADWHLAPERGTSVQIGDMAATVR